MPDLHLESRAVAAGRPPHRPGEPMNHPIAMSDAFVHGAEPNYLRASGSALWDGFETALGALEGGRALGFSSGMAASTAIVEGMPTGGTAVIGKALYSANRSLFGEQQRLGRMTVRAVDIADTPAVVAALDGANLLWIESPVNPLMDVADLPALIGAAHGVGATVVVDSTFHTPMVLRPLELGADVVLHSATKYLGGHSDLMMGALVTASEQRYTELRTRRTLTGGIPGVLETFLALRGLRTLAVRMDRAQANAGELARRLAKHPAVQRVRYPGLPDDPGHQRAAAIQDGFGAMIAFEVSGGAEAAERLCDRVRLITAATSLGAVESLIERRARYAIDAAMGVPDCLLRFSVGIEHVEDIWADLAQALA